MATRILGVSAAFLLALGAAPAHAAPAINYSVLDKGVPGSNGNSPEDDARPGEYYFMRGVESVRGKDYEHAVKMYEAAASWGYKNAQYNLAVMYARGEGIAQDLPRAMAWAALAAERNDKQYVEARELIYSLLSKEQWDQANVIWRELKKEYADQVALARAKARWAEVRNGMTGTHVGGAVGHLEVGAPAGGSGLAKVSASAEGSGNPLNPHSVMGKQGTTAGEVAGANTVEGSLVYRRLRETNDPYDPRLLPAIGTATVEPPQPVQDKKSDDATPAQ